MIDEDELEETRKNIARQIEQAFVDAVYPGDNLIVTLYNGLAHCGECQGVADDFKGKHWKDISLEVLYYHRLSLPIFTPEAFRFYLPAYLLGATLHGDDLDTLWENVFFMLAPPELEGPQMNHFLERINGLTQAQKAAIKPFIDLYLILETSYPDPKRERANIFWHTMIE